MRRLTLLGGIGGIAFAVLIFVAFAWGAPLGGSYHASDARNYVSSGHRTAAFVSVYLALIGVLGLVLLLARLREAIDGASGEQNAALTIFWGLGLVSAACFAAGFVVAFSVPIAYAYASSGESYGIGPAEVYAIAQAGGSVIYGAAGVLLGFTLITLFIGGRSALPAWLGWVTLIAGILGLASFGFFPWFALLIWSLVTGIWLLAAGRTGEVATARAAAPLP